MVAAAVPNPPTRPLYSMFYFIIDTIKSDKFMIDCSYDDGMRMKMI